MASSSSASASWLLGCRRKSSPRCGGDLLDGGQRQPGDGAVDRAQLERGVRLVDEHHQGLVPGGAGALRLQPDGGGVPVVAVGDHRTGIGEGLLQRGLHLGVGDPPDALQLVGAVGVGEVGRAGGGRRQHLADRRGSAVHEQDRGRVERHLGHPVGELPHLVGVHVLVGEDPARGAVQVEQRHDAADGDARRGVLVQVERRACVEAQVPLAAPVAQPSGDRSVGSGEDAVRDGITDVAVGQAECPERFEREPAPGSRRRVHSVNRRGCAPERRKGCCTRLRRHCWTATTW